MRYLLIILSSFTLSISQNEEITNDSLAILIDQSKKELLNEVKHIDSLAILIDQSKKELLNEVEYVDPLIGKKGGIEINPLYTLIYDEGFSFSASISMFPKDKNIEIAMPIALKSIEGNDRQARFRIDLLYRYFLGKHRKGRYIMWGLRHADFREYDYNDNSDSYVMSDEYSRQGISFGIGSRKFSESGIYWGWSFYAGKYLTGYDDDDYNDSVFINFEFLKFGITF